MSTRYEEIQDSLDQIETAEGVRVVYACESGSRAWGYASETSDYDVRFVYANPHAWYLSIEEKRDVINRPVTEDLDFMGWDLRKTLRLLRKSNPPLLEWLQSPIVYREHSAATHLKEQVPVFYSPEACLFHYTHMARRNYNEYLKADIVPLKKYFYVLRPILACRWIEGGRGPVPVEFEPLLETVGPTGAAHDEIVKLLARKREGEEMEEGPRIDPINAFIEAELDRFAGLHIPKHPPRQATEILDDTFRIILGEVWP